MFYFTVILKDYLEDILTKMIIEAIFRDLYNTLFSLCYFLAILSRFLNLSFLCIIMHYVQIHPFFLKVSGEPVWLFESWNRLLLVFLTFYYIFLTLISFPRHFMNTHPRPCVIPSKALGKQKMKYIYPFNRKSSEWSRGRRYK